MLQLNVKNETSRLRAVVLGTATSNGPTPTAEEAYDPKSLEHILAGTYPVEADMVNEMEAFHAVFQKYGVQVYRPEIITIPLEGDLAHKDSMGNTEVIKFGDVQVMSAGTGIQHSEFNPNHDRRTNLLQIWVFPKYRNVEPRYQQITLDTTDRHNKLQQILSPNADDAGVWIHQDAWFHMGNLDQGVTLDYSRKLEGNGLYVFVIKGSVKVDGQDLSQRDGLGITDFEKVTFEATSEAEILLMEVPMFQ